MINYESVDFNQILEYYNVRNAHNSGEEIQFSCPFPEHYRGDRNPSAGLNTKTGAWNCFSCGRKGTLVSFVADLEGVSPDVASRWIREGFSAAYKPNSMSEIVRQVKERKAERNAPASKQNVSKYALDLFYVDWSKAYEAYNDKSLPKRLSYVFDRGFSAATLEHYNIGYDRHTKRITIPLYDSEGNLVGFKGRSTNASETSKYLGVGDRKEKDDDPSYYGFPTCKTSNYVWGIHTVNPSDEYAIVVEGEFDAIWLRQLGFTTAIALGGSNPSISQVRQIKSNCSRVILLLDPDKAGKKAERRLTEKLLKFIPVRIAEVPDGLDPAEMNTQQIENAISKAKNPLLKHTNT